MKMHIDFKRLRDEELVRLGMLAVEAMTLSQEYDRSRSCAFCHIVAACNAEMLMRRRRAARHCGTSGLSHRAAILFV